MAPKHKKSMVDGPDCPGSRARRGRRCARRRQGPPASELDVLRLPCRLRPRQGQGLLTPMPASISTSAPATVRARRTAWSPTATALLLRLLRLDDQSRGQGAPTRLGRRHRRDGHGGGHRAARCRRQGDRGPQRARRSSPPPMPASTRSSRWCSRTAGLSPSGREASPTCRTARWSRAICRASGGAVGILGGLDDKPAEIKANGRTAAPATFPYSDFGVNQVGYCIVASTRDGREQSRPGEALHGGDDQVLQGGGGQSGRGGGGDGRHRRRHDGRGPEGKAQARAVLEVTLGVLYSPANKDKKLGLQRRRGLGRDAGADEEVQRPADDEAGLGVLHQHFLP